MKRLKDTYFTHPLLSQAIAQKTLIEWLNSTLKTQIPSLIPSDSYSFEKMLSICVTNPDWMHTLIETIKNVHICDPSCGDGNLLIAVADELHRWWILINQYIESNSSFKSLFESTLPPSPINSWIIANNIYGVDIQAHIIAQCRENLINWVHNKKDSPLSSTLNLHIFQGDALLGQLWVNNFTPAKYLENLQSQIKSNQYSDAIWSHLTPFHWGIAFPEISAKHGFDIIIGNPPWNAVKPFEKEFFAQYDSRLTRYTVDKNEAKKIVEVLLKDPEIKKKWLSYSQLIQLEISLYKLLFQHQTAEMMGKNLSADINYYKLFLERVFTLTNPRGVIGFLVPSGFYSDAGAKGLRELYFENSTVREIINFENRESIFSEIHRSFKFIFLLVSKREFPTVSFKAQFMLRDINYFTHYTPPLLEIDWDLLKKLSPESKSVIEFHSAMDIQIVKKMLDSHPLLLQNHPDIGKVHFKREFDMSLDSKLFSTEPIGLPLWEGKMIEEHTPYFSNPNRYYIKERIAIKKLYEVNTLFPSIFDHTQVRLGFRAVAASTNRRSMLASLLPPNIFCGNSIIVVKLFENGKRLLSSLQMLYLCGIFNSMVFDYLVRLKINTNLNMFFIYQMPVPVPPQDIQLAIAHRVLFLTEDWPAFENLRQEFQITGKALSYTERLTLMVEIDVLVGKLYRLNYEEMVYILAQFHQCNDAQDKLLRNREKLILSLFPERNIN